MTSQNVTRWLSAVLLVGLPCAAWAQAAPEPVVQEERRVEVRVEGENGQPAEDRYRMIAAGEEAQGDGHVTMFAPQMRKGTILGVSMEEVPVALRSQLELPEGHGILVGFVKPESPAAKAGLEKDDVLFMIEDQYAINAEQVSTLIRAHKPGDEVKLTVYNKGKKKTVKARLEEGDIPAASAATPGQWQFFGSDGGIGAHGMAIPGGHDVLLRHGAEGMPNFQRKVIRLGGEGGDLHKALMEWHAQVGGQTEPIPAQEIHKHIQKLIEMQNGQPPVIQLHSLPRLREMHDRLEGLHLRLGAGQGQLGDEIRQLQVMVKSEMGEGEGAAVTTKIIKCMDGEHCFTQSTKDGVSTLVVTDNQGKVLFDGPVNTDEERAKLPGDIAEKYNKVMKLMNIHEEPRKAKVQ